MLFEGKRGVILGVANDRSIAWHIARSIHAQGGQLILNYQTERLKESVNKLAEQLPGTICAQCDLTDDDQIDGFFKEVGRLFGGQLDFMVHSVAFAKREDLTGRFVDTSREGFQMAMEISVYTLAAAAQRAFPLMKAAGGGAIVTLSYYGAEKVIPRYNVMGVAKAALEASVRYMAADLGPDNIRVNAISAGPIKTLAARAIGDFNEILGVVQDRAPMRRNITAEEVGDSALFLLSDLARGITGEIMHVDVGFNVVAF